MFRSKESQGLTTVLENPVLTKGNVITRIVKEPHSDSLVIPDAVNLVFKQAADAFEEYNELIEIQKRIELPPGQDEAYRQRIAALEHKILGTGRLLDALKLGYDYHPVPSTYFAGHVSKQDVKRDRTGTHLTDLVFAAPMPLASIVKYETARKTNLFEDFLVLSPDGKLFSTAAPLRSDPVLVGIVKTGWEYRLEQEGIYSGNGIKPGLKIKDGQPLRIAHWDLGKDLEFIPNQQIPSREL